MGPTEVKGSRGTGGAASAPTGEQLAAQFVTQLEGLGKKIDASATPKETKALREGIKSTVKQLADLELNELKKLKAEVDKAPAAEKPAKQAALKEKADAYFGAQLGTASGLRARSYDRGMDETGRKRPETDQVNPASDLRDAQKIAEKAANEIREKYLGTPKPSGGAGWLKTGGGWQ